MYKNVVGGTVIGVVVKACQKTTKSSFCFISFYDKYYIFFSSNFQATIVKSVLFKT